MVNVFRIDMLKDDVERCWKKGQEVVDELNEWRSTLYDFYDIIIVDVKWELWEDT